MEKNTLFRLCPVCKSKINYSNVYDLKRADKKETLCKKCCINSGKLNKGHKLNDTFNKSFNNLDLLLENNCESFYWVGLLIADGYFNGNRFELSLSEKDYDYLKTFSDFIGFNKKLAYRKNTNSYRLAFDNKDSIPIITKKFNLLKNKTYNPINFNVIKDYDLDLLISLLIGIIDGDGTISKNGKSISYYVDITAHSSWELFYLELLNEIKIIGNITKVNKTNCIRIRIGKKNEIKKLLNIINKYNLPILKRKWENIDYSNSK